MRSRRDEEAYKHMKGPTTITVSFETEGGGIGDGDGGLEALNADDSGADVYGAGVRLHRGDGR